MDDMQKLIEKEAIRDQIYTYCRALDRIDNELGYTVFSKDAQVDYGDTYRGTGRGFIDNMLEQHGVHININTKIMEVTDHDVKVQRKDGTEEWLKGFDYILFGLGSRAYDPLSEKLKAFVPEVKVIGDAVKARQASYAMWEGFEAAYSL